MKVQDWMITAGVAVGGALVMWGGAYNTIGTLKEDVKDIKVWKDEAVKQMSAIDAKIDLLLSANGVTYEPKGGIDEIHRTGSLDRADNVTRSR